MKRWMAVGLFFSCFSRAMAADLTAGVNTPNYQSYNQNYRDVKDGTNAVTQDCVMPNSSAMATSTFTVVKTSGGYLDNITLTALCSGTSTYVIADSSFSAASYATVISTFTVNSGVLPTNIPIHVRFTNGLLVDVTYSSCPVVVSYR